MAKTTGAQKAPETLMVDVDTKDKDMLDLQDRGGTIQFDSSPARFKVLADETVEKLRFANARNYWLAYSSWIRALKEQENPPIKGLAVTGQPIEARASERTKVFGKKPGMHYAWMRPDVIRIMGHAGWRACQDPDVQSFCKTPDGTHKLLHPTEQGETEQVLMEIPDDLYEKNVDRPRKEKAMRRRTDADKKLKAEIVEAGALPYDKENDGVQWREEPKTKE